ncbi:MAG: glycosyltransferase family 2 protein [Candidatus Omnitrophica bacterium]|jgi:dolichol-phosphate mannosyltransferase|nr:glycosyltransferase family 2 protein [Candidatus Omnitrophota bacterium]
MNSNYKLSIIAPVYNEENNIKPFMERILTVIHDLRCDYEIIFVSDPCTDNTEDIIMNLRRNYPAVKLLKMSRRFGQPACTIAGIHYATGDACVVIDVDLQDPPEVIGEMVKKWKEGYHVVYAQRVSRRGETLIKRVVSYLGYRLINKMADVKIPANTGDFRLMSKEVVGHLKELKEHDGFLRGLVAYIGFSQIGIPYHRDKRFAGKGNYNRLFGSIRIGLNGVFGFSKYPLHLISILGVIISLFSFLFGMTYLLLKLLNFDIKWGNPTLVILISFLSGLQLLSLGIMGEYFARIYDEMQKRPAYIIDKAVGFEGIK